MKKIVFLLIFTLVRMAVFAQLSLNLNIGFEPDPDILNWAAQPNTIQVTVTNNSNQTIQYKYAGKMLRNGQVVMDNNPAKMPIETIGPLETKVAFVEDVLPVDAVTLYGDIQKTYAKTNAIPGGQYLICVKIIDLQGRELAPDNCRPFQMTSYQQPALIFPLASTPISSMARPMFSWTPVTPTPNFPVVYRLRVVEVPDNLNTRSAINADLQAEYEFAKDAKIIARGDRKITGVWKLKAGSTLNTTQSRTAVSSSSNQLSTEALRALNYGFPMIDMELNGVTQYLWSPDVQEPTAGHSYVWSVQALRADNGKPIGDNNGLSQPAVFTVMEDASAGRKGWDGTVKKRYDFIIADGNGCLYGCTTGVWQPIDCPDQTRSVSSLPKTLKLQGNPIPMGTEKAWVLVDNRSPIIPEPQPKLPLSNFSLSDPAKPPVNVVMANSASGANQQPASFNIELGKAQKSTSPIHIVLDNSAEVTESSPIHIVLDNSADRAKPSSTTTSRAAKSPIHIVLDNSVTLKKNNDPNARKPSSPIHIEFNNPVSTSPIHIVLDNSAEIYLNVAVDGKITKAKSEAECTGAYCISLSKCCDKEGGNQGNAPTQRGYICYVDDAGLFPMLRCFELCTLQPDNTTLPTMNVEDVSLDCINLISANGVNDGSIILDDGTGSAVSLKPDGTYAPFTMSTVLKEQVAKVAQTTRAGQGGNEPTAGYDVSFGFFFAMDPNDPPNFDIDPTAPFSFVPTTYVNNSTSEFVMPNPNMILNNIINPNSDFMSATFCYFNPSTKTVPFVWAVRYRLPGQTLYKTIGLPQCTHCSPSLVPPTTVTKQDGNFLITITFQTGKIRVNLKKTIVVGEPATPIGSNTTRASQQPANGTTAKAFMPWIPVQIQPKYVCFNWTMSEVKSCKDCQKGSCYQMKSGLFRPASGQTAAPTLPPLNADKLAKLDKIAPDEAAVFISQDPTTGELTRLTKPENCPKGSFLLFFEKTDETASAPTTKTMGQPIGGLDVKGGRPGIAATESNTNASTPTTKTMGDPVPGLDVKGGRKPPGGNPGIITSGTTDANGNVELMMKPELGKTYYVLYTPKSTGAGTNSTKSSVTPVEITLKDFEKAWVLVDNRANAQPIVVTQKVGDDVVTIQYFKNGVRVNVAKSKK